MGFLISRLSASLVGLGVIVERNRIIAEAERLRDAAAVMGMLDEVAQIIAPPVKRKRGRQPGSRSRKLAERRDALWAAYLGAKLALPGNTEAEIAEYLFAKGGRKYGNSASAIESQVMAIKAKRNVPSLLSAAGHPTKRGRPKKSAANPI
jgi:hypothetical protein